MKRLVRIPVLALSLAFVSCRDSSGPEGIDIFGCKQGMEYTIGQTVNGSIRSSDCGSASEGFGDFYRIRLTNAGPVSISVQTTNSSDPLFVILVDASEEIVDLSGIEPGESATIGGQLEAGTYYMLIGGQDIGDLGTYTLTSSRTLPPSGTPFLGCTTAQSYTLNSTVSGTLASGDCVSDDGSYLDRYQFTLATARTVTINLQSTAFDAFLYLFNAEGTVLARNDDFGTGLNSRISVTLQPGTYSIGATSFEFGEGPYTLTTQ